MQTASFSARFLARLRRTTKKKSERMQSAFFLDDDRLYSLVFFISEIPRPMLSSGYMKVAVAHIDALHHAGPIELEAKYCSIARVLEGWQ